ncbi:unnamed protein product [Peronospora effusa]|nr:unnamed protein product [Peronospora effusa]
MKFAVITIAAIVAMMNVVTGTIAGVDMSALDPATTVLSQSKALEAAKHNSMPDGVEFTGSIEQIDQPADAKEILEAMQTKHDDADRWAGFGPYRFGFRCGGVPGWAYPLSYWNIFGAGLYGGGCSLGMPFGGLYYC